MPIELNSVQERNNNYGTCEGNTIQILFSRDYHNSYTGGCNTGLFVKGKEDGWALNAARIFTLQSKRMRSSGWKITRHTLRLGEILAKQI